MSQSLIERFGIKHMSQSESSDGNRINMTFYIDGFQYTGLNIKNSEGKFYLITAFHVSEKKCPLCLKKENEFGDCGILNTYKNELFQELIEVSSVRLDWLYLPHV